MKELTSYLQSWQDDPSMVRPFFLRLLQQLRDVDANLEFVVRPKISASLRVRLAEPGMPASIFCLVDIIEDAAGRWLSVCFYAPTVTDPEERGNLIPDGLLGEDGYCFDLDGADSMLEQYILARVEEARRTVAAGARQSV